MFMRKLTRIMSINFEGIPVVLDPRMGKYIQVKFPRSKKKRIRRKWRKNHKNYAWVSDGQVYQMGGRLYMHPAMWERLKKEMNKRNDPIAAAKQRAVDDVLGICRHAN